MINVLNINHKNVLVLDDAVDVRDFKKSKNQTFKNTCFYSGSFVEGKGIEIIQQLALQTSKFLFPFIWKYKNIYKSQIL